MHHQRARRLLLALILDERLRRSARLALVGGPTERARAASGDGAASKPAAPGQPTFKKLVMPDVPFLGPLISQSASELAWEQQLPHNDLVFLRCHRVGKVPLLPGTCYIEMARNMAMSVHPGVAAFDLARAKFESIMVGLGALEPNQCCPHLPTFFCSPPYAYALGTFAVP